MPSLILKPKDADLPSSNPAQLVNVNGTNFAWAELRYDATTQESVTYSFQMDQFYDNGSITINFWWKAAATTGNVVWQVNLLSRAEGQLFDTALGSDFYIQDAAQGTTEYLNKATLTINNPNLTRSQVIIVKVSRDADSTNATDDMAGDAKLLEVEVDFQVAA